MSRWTCSPVQAAGAARRAVAVTGLLGAASGLFAVLGAAPAAAMPVTPAAPNSSTASAASAATDTWAISGSSTAPDSSTASGFPRADNGSDLPTQAEQTLYVATTGSDDDNTCTSSAKPCQTIHHAIGQVENADYMGYAVTILVGQGTYNDNIDIDAPFLDSLSVKPDSTTGKVTIDGGARAAVVSINHGTVVLERLTLTNGGGRAGTGGGVSNLHGDMTLVQDTIRNNTATFAGGGVYNGAVATLVGDTVTFNTAGPTEPHQGDGGGVYNDGYLTLTSDTIIGNTALHGNGGGIYNRGSAIVSLSSITGNKAPEGTGGGVYEREGSTLLPITTVFGNTPNNCTPENLCS